MSASVSGTKDASDPMEWETIVDIDPATEYVYFGQRGESELGGESCREAVWADGVGFGRSYPLPGDPAFDPSGSPGEFADLISGLPFSIEQLEALTGAEADADTDGVRLSVVLTDDALDALEVTLFNAHALGGAPVEYATLDASANAAGELRWVTVAYESENGEQLVLDATVSNLADADRVTSSDTIESTGWCARFWSESAPAPIGFWLITAVLDGERIFDEWVDETPALFVYPDGTLAGNTGCSEIVGTATVGADGVSEFDVHIDGPSCPDEHLDRERTVITALNSGSVTIGHAGSLNVGVEGAALVVLFAVG